MKRWWSNAVGVFAVSLGLLGCGDGTTPIDDAGTGDAGTRRFLSIEAPEGFPAQRVPADSPWTLERAELGRRLFYDRRLSQNQTQSCGSCHQQSRAFTDGRATAEGSTGQAHPRASMGLTNIGYTSALTWASTILRTLEAQALVPMFGEKPVELGFAGQEGVLLQRLRDDAEYPAQFARAYPREADPISVANLTRAIASFERTLRSANSPYDRAQRGDANAMSASARRGQELFFSERLECFHCHGGFNFADSVTHEGLAFDETGFHNNGLYNIDGQGGYPAPNTGLHAQTGDPADMGRFRAPTLRNVAVTAPFMHDGSIATLTDVVRHYAAGGRNITSGPFRGDGRASPLKSGFIQGFAISESEIADVVAFLESLTDQEFLSDPRYADPFGNER